MFDNQRSSRVVNNPRDIYLRLNPSGVITYINKPAVDFFKWQSESVVGLSYFDLCAKYEYLSWLPEDLSTLSKSQEILVKTHLSKLQVETNAICGHAVIRAVVDEQDVVCAYEISGKLSAEEITYLSHDIDMQELVKNLPGSTYWKDANGLYLWCNDYMLRLANLDSLDDIVGKTDYDLPWKDVADKIRETDVDVLKTGKLHEVEEYAMLSDGTKNYVMSHKAPLYNTKGDIIGIIGQSANITELKEAQQGLREAKEALALSNQAKSDFLDNMRHDIRTPISCILGAGRILRDMESDPDKLEWINAIIESSESLNNFFARILDFINVESGSQPVRSKRFSLSSIIENIVNMSSVSVKQKNIQLKSVIDSNIPDSLVGDEFRLQRVLLNLVSNSIKFTHQGSVTLTIQLQKQVDRDVILQFQVTDTGVGISKDNIDNIFEKFTSTSGKTYHDQDREGLGLSIVTQYLHDINGEIDVSSQEGVGSTFTCTVPFRVSLLEEPAV